jgi:hypothetical protein
MHEMEDLISQLDIETDVMNVRKKDTDQAGNERNIKGKVKLDLNLEKNENQNEQTKGRREYQITRNDDTLWSYLLTP